MHLGLLLAAYLCGGLTFIPLVVLSFFLYGLVVFPRRDEYRKNTSAAEASTKTPVSGTGEAGEDADLKEKLRNAERGADVAAGYFAVCREYVPAGVNGKPPERTTPAGETIAAESPSVYQSMYRSIFDRNKSQAPTIEAGKPVKRARNIFYVVLRHGHLMLFDNSEQLEVRHVISLTHYDVDIYGGEGVIPEGELYIKRNCIRLLRKKIPDNATANLAPFYLFSDNCSEKEDFYHALLQSQRKFSDSGSEWPESQEFDTDDMIKLVRQLHLAEDKNQTRWLNALIGRLFLALYKTNEIESLIRNKISKKISRVQKPAFITSLTLEDISMGESGPTFSSLKLREITVDGGLTLEADMKYSGKFRAVIAAVAKLELGQRFKPREVDLVLAGDLQRLDGHVLVRIKPPPSNRIWFSFETMPKIEMAIEPIVSSRQITYGIITRAIESRIREVFGETLVSPNWDDIPFMDTESQRYRGGVWKEERKTSPPLIADVAATATAATAALAATQEEETDVHGEDVAQASLSDHETTIATPQLHIPQSASTHALLESERSPDDSLSPLSPSDTIPPISLPRSNSYASPATASPAIVTKIPVMSNKTKKKNNRAQRDATSTMKYLNSKSRDSSPLNTPSRLPRSSTPQMAESSRSSVGASSNPDDTVGPELAEADNLGLSPNEPSADSTSSKRQQIGGADDGDEEIMAASPSENASIDRRATMNQSLMSATAAAKKWGLGMMQRNRETIIGETGTKLPSRFSTSEPIGRGQPLPPPGEPLPGPADSRSWTTGTFGSLKRKPVAKPSNSTPVSTHQKSSSISSISSISNFFMGSTVKDVETKNTSAGTIYDESTQADASVPTEPPAPPKSSPPTEPTTESPAPITSSSPTELPAPLTSSSPTESPAPLTSHLPTEPENEDQSSSKDKTSLTGGDLS